MSGRPKRKAASYQYRGVGNTNPTKRPVSAENAILARQRQVAARLTGIEPVPAVTTKGPSSSSSGSSAAAEGGEKEEYDPNKQKRLLLQAMQKKKLDAMFRPNRPTTKQQPQRQQHGPSSSFQSSKTKQEVVDLSDSPPKAYKRPSRPKKDTVVDLSHQATAEEAIAASRAKLNIKQTDPPPPPPPSSKTADSKPQSSKKSSILTQITAKKTASNLKMKSAGYYPKVEVTDYWKNIRKWDFYKDLVETLSPRPPPNNQDNKKNNNSSTKPGNKQDKNSASSSDHKKDVCLPDRFESHQQYISSWAPLCLQEARAQILSEVSQEVPYWNKPGRGPVKVLVQPLKKDLMGDSEAITLQIAPPKQTMTAVEQFRNGGGGGGRGDSFMPNDIVLLVRDEKTIYDLLPRNRNRAQQNRNNSSSSSSCDLVPPNKRRGLLGISEFFRKTTDGLMLSVSRKIWTDFVSDSTTGSAVNAAEMYLMKIGSNVTALREFSALCQVQTIPLLNYLLANNLTPSNTSSSMASCPFISDQDDEKKKSHLLANMGGAMALGKGFTKYAQKKFNTSQLGAISTAAGEYGKGGFTLVKGPPGTGKTTTLVALVNSLHIKQFNKYYEAIKAIATTIETKQTSQNSSTQTVTSRFAEAMRTKPRILVCAPSNAAVDNIILKIMEVGFVDGNGARYNPSMVRVGSGQSDAVKDVALEKKVDILMYEGTDIGELQQKIAAHRVELARYQNEILRFRKRAHAILVACPWPVSTNWEIRIDEETFDNTGRVYFVNHKEKRTTFEFPPPPEPGETQIPPTKMPEFRSHVHGIVKNVEKYNALNSQLQVNKMILNAPSNSNAAMSTLRQQLETRILDNVHIVLTTLGTAGSRILEGAAKFEVVVVDEAAQSVEPATLNALGLGSSHAILVGDPQQLPATIFSVSGRSTKYDRSLFQRLEEAGHSVHLLNTQYRMNPKISDFPRRIFYEGQLKDGPNVTHAEYGNPLRRAVLTNFPHFQPFTLLDLDSAEERGGTSLSNSSEARLALHLYNAIDKHTGGAMLSKMKVAVITPYAQQANLLRNTFSSYLGDSFPSRIDVNTVDSFQGREANIVIFSCVRAAGSRGIGFLSDVRRMNVALTRAKHFLFVIARAKSIVVNPYWRDLVEHARDTKAVIPVPMIGPGGNARGAGGNHQHHHHKKKQQQGFPDLNKLQPLPPRPKDITPIFKTPPLHSANNNGESECLEDGEL